jgi:hypothetical protein
MKLKRKDANWQFGIHLNYDKGPNRITFSPDEALRYFKKILRRNPEVDTVAVKVMHLPSQLVWETDDPEDLNEFIHVLVNRVGVTYHG